MAASNDSSPNFDFLNGDPSGDGDTPSDAASGWSPSADSAVGMVDSPAGNGKKPIAEDDETNDAKPTESTDAVSPDLAPSEDLSEAAPSASTDDSDMDSGAEDPATEATTDEPLSFEPPAAEEAPQDEAPQFDAFTAAEEAPDFSAMSPDVESASNEVPESAEDELAGAEPPALAVTQVSNSARPKRSTAKKSTAKTSTAKKSATDKSTSSRKSSSKAKNSDSGFSLAGPLAIGLVSYAVLATALLVYLLMYNESHQLESLPDRPPLSADEFRFVPETAAVAPGHELRIGESARFGNILVEAVRVTRDQAELEHYAKKEGLTAPPAGENVIKLWLKLTNVSTDQRIAPFDRKLVYDRRFDADFIAHSDQYVVPASERGTDAPNVDMYDISPDGEWDLKGQAFPVLNPGESVTTYLAAGPDEIERLTGTSVWRMLVRKGFNDRTGNGVLTLIDVVFDASKAVSES